MNEKKTEELNQILQEVKLSGLPEYMKENRGCMKDAKRSFYYYMKDVLDSKNIKLKDVYSFAGVSESYGSKILSQEKHTTDRNLIIRFCIAGHFTWDETSRALKLYGMNELYAKDPRDALLILEINNRIFDIDKINKNLTEHGFNPLSKDDK